MPDENSDTPAEKALKLLRDKIGSAGTMDESAKAAILEDLDSESPVDLEKLKAWADGNEEPGG